MKAPDGATAEQLLGVGNSQWVEGKPTNVLTSDGTEAGELIEVELT